MNPVLLTTSKNHKWVAATFRRGKVTLLKTAHPGASKDNYEVSLVMWLKGAVSNLLLIETLPKSGKASIESVTFNAVDGQEIPFRLNADGSSVMVTQTLQPGEYVLRYTLVSALPLNQMITQPNLTCDESEESARAPWQPVWAFGDGFSLMSAALSPR